MSYSLHGAVVAIGFIAVVTGYTAVNRTMNYTPAKASVFLIDRQCNFDRQYEDGKREKVTQSCTATDEFKALAAAPKGKRAKDVDGKAVVKISYTAPQDGSYQTAELRYDGRDERFYTLKAGDQIDIMVSNEDPSKVTT